LHSDQDEVDQPEQQLREQPADEEARSSRGWTEPVELDGKSHAEQERKQTPSCR
jgi:hypothetical protein